MERFIKGDIVVIPFPFSDLSQSKKRPALVIASLDGEDIILAQITSKNKYDAYAIEITGKDFIEGGLKVSSNVRANKLFTASKGLILYKVGRINQEKIEEVINKIIEIIKL